MPVILPSHWSWHSAETSDGDVEWLRQRHHSPCYKTPCHQHDFEIVILKWKAYVMFAETLLRNPSRLSSCIPALLPQNEKGITCILFPRAAAQAQICTKYDPWRSSNWIVSLLMNYHCISIPTVRKSLPCGAQFPQDWRNPNSIWPSIITSRLEKHVGSNWILSFCTWYEGTASKPLYPVTVHTFFSLYWLALSIFLVRKKGAIKIHEGYVCRS